ncbi:MAG: hypothetical protein JHD16_16440, partial [Solirubrobacteraceae bacterium]|nr:hypothetical protein [Solirubrobacteraceae bacterium]
MASRTAGSAALDRDLGGRQRPDVAHLGLGLWRAATQAQVAAADDLDRALPDRVSLPTLMPRRPPRIVPAVVAIAGLALCAAPAAQATLLYEPTGRECHLAATPGWDVAGPALADPLGYRYDAGSADDGYATLDEGSTDLLKVGVLADDAWDRFGALMVGPNRSSVSLYRDPANDALGCSTELSGRQLVFKPVAMGSLSAQRRLFVSASQGSGARLLDSVTNAGTTPITTNVYVGDLRSYNDGSLGSDSTTKLAATSSSDTTLTTADRWAVTTDGRSIGSDPALAHVWAGVGADEPVSLVRSGAQTGGVAALDSPAALDEDQLGWGWEGVTLAPGETRSFLSWETMRASVDGKASTQAPLAAAAAEAQSTAA